MKRRDRTVALLFFTLLAFCSKANDGAYKGSGGNLIPISDSTISVRKEILKFTRKDDNYVEVDVYYEFYNDGDTKEMIIGFEAMSAYGDASIYPRNGYHPYISNFSVNVNEENLAYQVAVVEDSIYFKNGYVNGISTNRISELTEDTDYADFFYVYHFTCTMKQGLNIVKHSYKQEMSSSVITDYSIDYVLTAASRWKGKVIRDFTLQLDLGAFQRYSIMNTFFQTMDNWSHSPNTILLGKMAESYTPPYEYVTVISDDGLVTFRQDNFVPSGELHVASFRSYVMFFDPSLHNLPNSFSLIKLLPQTKSDFGKTILRNYPFALRGYVFKGAQLQAYFEQQDWYIRDPTYGAVLKSLPKDEQEWVLGWSN